MRISDLVRRTGVAKETIHFYIREGILPKPQKLGRNSAEYSEDYVERIMTVKELQDRFYLPLSVIKQIMRRQKKTLGRRNVLRLRGEYLRPIDQLLPAQADSEEAFLEATDMTAERLQRFEDWKVITPETRDGRKIYSQEDLNIGRIIGDLRKLGISAERGFQADGLKVQRDMFREIVAAGVAMFDDATRDKWSAREISEVTVPGREVMALFFYHLYLKLAREMSEEYEKKEARTGGRGEAD